MEAAERLVCRLYGVPAELEEAVVRHAVERAGGERRDASGADQGSAT